MNLYHQKAIELKYQGMTYPEISVAMGGKIKVNQLKHLFEHGGYLFLDYLKYEAQMNKVRAKSVHEAFEKDCLIAAAIMRSLLQKALKEGNIKMAFEILKEQMDRSGFVVVRNVSLATKAGEGRKPQTYEEFKAECARQGIDYNTGLRLEPSVSAN